MPHTFSRFPHRQRKGVRAVPGEALTVSASASEAGPLRCRCGAVAMRRVGTRGYCASHTAEAWRAAAKEAGHASPDALMRWIDGMNIEEEA